MNNVYADKPLDQFEQYALHLLRLGKSQTTIEKDITIIKRLSTLIPLQKDDIERYLLMAYQEGRKPGYLNNIIKAVRTYGEFIKDKSFKKIKYFRIKEQNKATLSDTEIEDFLALPKPKQSKPDRYHMWTLFFKTMAYSGMRAGEVANLTIPQVDFGRGLFILDKTKTSPRLVPISPGLIKELEAHIKLLPTQQLFTIDGQIVDKNKWNEHFQMRIRRLGIRRPHLSTHSLRHSFITRMLSEDVNIFKVQRIVGHKDIATTSQYTHLGTKDIIKAIKKDPLLKKYLSEYEILKNISATISALLENENERFDFNLEESADSIHFSLKIKKPVNKM